MKTYKNIYQKICSYENLNLAFRKARKGKTSKEYVKEFEKTFAEILRSAHPNDVTPAPLKNTAEKSTEKTKLPAAKTDTKKQAIEKKK